MLLVVIVPEQWEMDALRLMNQLAVSILSDKI